jgi:Tol biopolymer transport system component/DNA-binding winged helix-turn-helix (wHTH) protein
MEERIEPSPPQALRFGVFEVDPALGELRKQGRKVRLQEQPLQILLMLLARPGELVTRDELRQRLWPADTFVDFEHGVNAAVKRLRDALGDSADNSRFIETLPRRGYRFVAPVGGLGQAPAAPAARTRLAAALTLAALLAVIAIGVAWWPRRTGSSSGSDRVLMRLTSDAGLTTDPALSADGTLLAYASDRGGEGNFDIYVQQLTGGQPLRLTRDDADDREPSFSPDGTRVAFRSSRGGGGIYVVPALGGEERLIAREGRRPRFSPDGKQIAYWTGAGDMAAAGTSRMYAVASDGGPPRQLRSDFAAAQLPVWSPDGTRVLFLGAPDASGLITGDRDDDFVDWWVSPLGPGPPLRTGVVKALREHGLSGVVAPQFWARGDDRIFFSDRSGDSVNVWEVTLSPKSGRVTGAPKRVTSGTAAEVQPSLGPDGTVIFSSRTRDIDLWSVPIAADEGTVRGAPQRVTQTATEDINPYLSRDGKTLAYASRFSGNADIELLTLDSGRHVAVTRTPSEESWPVISPDGARVAYGVSEQPSATAVYVTDRAGVREKICEDCGRIRDWSPDGKRILYLHGHPRRVAMVDIGSGRKTDILMHPSQNLYQSSFARDGRWITFIAQTSPENRRLLIAPFHGEAVAEKDWIQVTDGSFSDDKPRLSPKGNLLYFTSDRDGFVCFWAQRLQPESKRSLGDPFPVHHFHSTRLSMTNVPLPWGDIGVSSDRIVFPLAEMTGNIWMARAAASPRRSSDR